MDIVIRLRATTTDKDNMPRMDSERWFPVSLAKEAADEIERLRRCLQWYADATAEDFANDNGFNATAVLTT